MIDAGTEGITAHYNNVALASLPANTSVFDTAHFFALFNVAQFDGRIVYFTMKYNNLFWRPITAAYQLIRYMPLLQGGQSCRVALTRLDCTQYIYRVCCCLRSTSAHSSATIKCCSMDYMKQHVPKYSAEMQQHK